MLPGWFRLRERRLRTAAGVGLGCASCSGSPGVPDAVGASLAATRSSIAQREERVATDKLIDIARNDPDTRYRKRALFWLGQNDDPRVQQLLLEILSKP